MWAGGRTNLAPMRRFGIERVLVWCACLFFGQRACDGRPGHVLSLKNHDRFWSAPGHPLGVKQARVGRWRNQRSIKVQF